MEDLCKVFLVIIGIITAYWWIKWIIASILLPFRIKEIKDLLENTNSLLEDIKIKMKLESNEEKTKTELFP